MSDLFARAERVIPGERATPMLDEVRAELEAAHGRSLIYEVVPPADGSEWIERRMRLLSDYLHSRRFGTIGGPGVRVAIWMGPQLHLFTTKVFFGYVAELRGVTLAALEAELRAAQRAETN